MNLSPRLLARVRLSPLMAAALVALLVSISLAANYAYRAVAAPLLPELVSKPGWRAPTALDVTPMAAISDEADTPTLTRPIFSKSRRPSPERSQVAKAAAAAATAPLPGGLNVKAMVSTGAGKSAFILCDAFPEGKWLTQGETIQGWTIMALRDLEVVLKNGEQTTKWIIDYSSKGATQQF